MKDFANSAVQSSTDTEDNLWDIEADCVSNDGFATDDLDDSPTLLDMESIESDLARLAAKWS